MKLNDFQLECYFEKYEFSAPYLLAQSDCEDMTAQQLLALEPGAAEAFAQVWLGYTETKGDPLLRQAVAEQYSGITQADVLMLCGAQEGILAYMSTVLNPGDHAIVMYPNYPSAWEAIRANDGCSFDFWKIHDTEAGWQVDFEELESLIRHNTRLIAVNAPNNPTGFAFTEQQLRQLCDLCRKYDLRLFSDEVYRGLEAPGQTPPAAAELYEKATSLSVMSKAYGLAGLRVGWLVSRDREVLDRVLRFKHYTSICNAAPSEFLSRIALMHSQTLLSRNRQIIEENKKTAAEFFCRYPQVFEEKPMQAGPVAFHKLRIPMTADEFCRRAVEQQGVLLLPGNVFGGENQYFRMGYGRKNFPENLQKLEAFLQKEKF